MIPIWSVFETGSCLEVLLWPLQHCKSKYLMVLALNLSWLFLMDKISTPLAFNTAILIWANIVQISWVASCVQDGFKMSSSDFGRGKNKTRCFTGLNLLFGAQTGNLNWGNSEKNYTGLTWKRNSFPPSYVEINIVSIVCFGTKEYFSRIEFVRFYAHYRKKKIVFLWVLQSINNISNCDSGSPPPLPPSSEFSGSVRPCSLIIFT